MKYLNLMQLTYKKDKDDLSNTSLIGITTQDELGWIEGIIANPEATEQYFVYGSRKINETELEFALLNNYDNINSTIIYDCVEESGLSQLHMHKIAGDEIVEENLFNCRISFTDT